MALPQNNPQPNQPIQPSSNQPPPVAQAAPQAPPPPMPTSARQVPAAQHFGQLPQPAAPHNKGVNIFDAPVPGQSLTDTPKNAQWEHPPKYTKLDDALHYVFDQLIKPFTLKQTFTLLQKGVPVEHLVRLVLYTGFTEGYWTPDLALLMVRPVTSIIAGIAHRAGIKEAKMTATDRSGFKHLMKMQNIPTLSTTNPVPVTATKDKLQGLMSPPKE